MSSRFLIAALISMISTAVYAECPPEKFLLDEKTELLQDDEVRLAFVETMNDEQFQRAKKQFGSGGSVLIYGVPISGYANLSDAKEAGRKEQREKRFNYDRKQSYHLLQNRVSASGAQAYIKCLENENPGVRLWVIEQSGSIYKIALKVKPGTPADFRLKNPTLFNFDKLSTIDTQVTLSPTVTYPFTFRRKKDSEEAFIELRVGSLNDQLIFPPVQRLVPSERKVYESKKFARATSSGQEGTRESKHCESAPDGGWHFVSGTGNGIPRPGFSEGASGGVRKVTITPQQACVIVWAYTGDERVSRAFEATFTVTMERPMQAAESTAPPQKKRR